MITKKKRSQIVWLPINNKPSGLSAHDYLSQRIKNVFLARQLSHSAHLETERGFATDVSTREKGQSTLICESSRTAGSCRETETGFKMCVGLKIDPICLLTVISCTVCNQFKWELVLHI